MLDPQALKFNPQGMDFDLDAVPTIDPDSIPDITAHIPKITAEELKAVRLELGNELDLMKKDPDILRMMQEVKEIPDISKDPDIIEMMQELKDLQTE